MPCSMHFNTRFYSAKLGVLLGGENSSAGLRAVPGKCVGQMAIQVGLIEHFYFCGFSKMNWQARSKVVTHSLWVPDLEFLSWNLLLSCETYLGNDTTGTFYPHCHHCHLCHHSHSSPRTYCVPGPLVWFIKTDCLHLCNHSVMYISVSPSFGCRHCGSRRLTNLPMITETLKVVLRPESRTFTFFLL